MASEMLYQQIRKYVLQLIDENRTKPNYRLPSENQLCIKFHASRVSVQRALRALEEEGLIYRQQGRGTFIRQQSNIPTEIRLKKGIIGMLVPTLDSKFICDIVESAQEHLESRGMSLAIFSTHDNPHMENELINTILDIGSKGLIIMPVSFSHYSDEMLRLALNKFPTVQVDRYLPGLPSSVVSCDHFHSAYNITALLQSQGHKVIGFVSQPMEYCSAISIRFSGYERAMLEADVLYNSQIRFTKDIAEPDYEANFNAFLDAVKPSALICTSKFYGAYISKVFADRKIRMMKDITLAVYDMEYPDVAAYTDQMPIIIDQQPREIGRCAVEELMRLISGESISNQIFIPEKIIMPAT